MLIELGRSVEALEAYLTFDKSVRAATIRFCALPAPPERPEMKLSPSRTTLDCLKSPADLNVMEWRKIDFTYRGNLDGRTAVGMTAAVLAATQRRHAMSEIEVLHKSIFVAVESHDVERIKEIYHPDAVLMTSDGVNHNAQEYAKEIIKSFGSAFPDLKITIRNHFVLNDSVSIVEYTFSGTHKGEFEGIDPTGKTMEVAGCSVIEVRNGKIVQERDYYDNMALLTQLGVADT
jgi:steroid delta-isomerase-like uncharacterized protein